MITGDTLAVTIYEGQGNFFNQIFKVTDVQRISLGADSVNMQTISPIGEPGGADCSFWIPIQFFSEPPTDSFPSAIIEGLGHIATFFSDRFRYLTMPFSQFLRCYEDSTGKIFRYPNYTFPCDTTYKTVSVNTEPSIQASISFYPKPTSTILHLALTSDANLSKMTLHWINSLGQEVRKDPLPPQIQSHQFQLAGMLTGCYFLVLKDDAGTIIWRDKVLITH